MNKIYRIVFNAVTGRWVVASELATGRKKQGGGERVAVAAVLVSGALGSLMGAAHAGVVVNGDPQEASASCELITDSGTTTWTASTSAGACLAPVLAGSASGQGNPGADAVFYASSKTNGSEDSLNLGGYLDTWKTATFHGGIAMDGQKITGLANGTAATDAATYGQLTSATRYFKAGGAGDGTDDSSNTGKAIAIGAGSVSTYSGGVATWTSTAIGVGAKATAQAATALGGGATASTGNATAIGVEASAAGSNSTVVGVGSTASAAHGVALGAYANASANSSVALGNYSTTTANLASAAYNPGAAALSGTASPANGEVSIGSATKERRLTNLAAGSAATDAVNVSQLQAEDATVDQLGANAAAALGGGASYNATTGAITAPSYALTNANTIAGTTGAATDVGGAFSTVDSALGKVNTFMTTVNNGGGVKYVHVNSSLADSSATGAEAIAVGGAAVASGTGSSIAVGQAASAAGQSTVALGQNASALGSAGIAIGQRASNVAGANNTVAIGGDSKSGDKSISIGNGADTSTQAWSTALGTNSSVTGATGVALGASASVTAANAVALGANAVADRANTVSVGKSGAERQVVNMAKGTADTDAVNVAQLKGVTGAIGGGAAVNADGTIKAPSYALSNANTIGGTSGAAADVGAGFAKVDSALGALSTTANKGFNISADAGATSQNIAPGGTVKFNAGSNATVSRSGDTVTYSVVSNPTFSGLLTANGGLAVGAGKTIDMGGNKVTNVADGSVASASKEAVNGGQLYTTNQNVTALDGRVTTAEGKISTLTTNVSTLDSRVTQNTTDIAGNTTSITNLQNTVNNISNGSAGLVQQSAAGANLMVGKGTDGAAVDFAGTSGARKLLNVENGNVAANSKDAVNGGQLYTTNQAVAQNTAAISMLDGRVTTNEGDIGTLKNDVTNIDGRVSTAEGDITRLDNRVTTNEGDISTLKSDVTNNTNSISTLNTSVSNIDSRVSTVEGSVTTITNQLSNGEIGLVKQDATTRVITVAKDADGAVVDIKGTSGARKLTGVADGTVAAGSKDAVNGGQLDATNQVVARNVQDIATLDGRVSTNEGDISTLKSDVTTIDNRVTTNEGDISTIKTDVTKIDGRVSTAETNINTLNTNVSTLDGRVTTVEGSVTHITNQLNSGEIGLVQYDDAAGVVSVAKDKAGTAVDFRGTAGARRLKGVAAGGEDEDAVNVSQLKKVTDAIGGGATVNADGSVTAPTYYVTNADGSKSAVTNMGDAMSNLDGRVYTNTTQIQSISTQISSGTIGMVQQAGAGQKLTVGKDTDGTEVDFADKNGNARKLTNVADGKVEAGSKDAVNGGQLHAVSQSMASALGGGSVVNADGTVTAPVYTVTNADGSSSQVAGVEGAISNIDNRVYQNTTAITNNTTAISNLSTQISNGEVGLVKQDAATRQITVAKDSDGTSVSVAGTAGDRVVTGVAAAKADNDAVNLGQLKSAGIISANGEAKSVITYDSGDKSSITMGGEGATTAVTIHNVADGVADHDAVNVSQLNQRLQQNTTEVLVQANSYTDQKIGDVWTGMDKLATEVAKQDGRISQHGAMSMAEAQMASGAAAAAVGNPNGAWSVGLGSEQGHGAISAGYAKPVGKKSQISFGAAFGGDDHSVGVGFAHKL